jgi:hypothetical protein
MGDYANYGRDLFKAAGFVYIAISVIAIGLALWFPKGKVAKAIAAGIVITLASILPIQGLQEIRAQQAKADEFKQRYDKAKALFDERCKTAGIKIFKTAPERVDTLFLPRLPERKGYGYEQFEEGAVLYGQAKEFNFTWAFLLGAEPSLTNPYGFTLNQKGSDRPGLRYVVAVDPKDGQRYQYSWEDGKGPHKQLSADARPPRYAFEFETPLDSAERDNWIASGVFRVRDTQDNSLMAEAKFFKLEPGLGSRAGQRTPWASTAQICPQMKRSGAT